MRIYNDYEKMIIREHLNHPEWPIECSDPKEDALDWMVATFPLEHIQDGLCCRLQSPKDIDGNPLIDDEKYEYNGVIEPIAIDYERLLVCHANISWLFFDCPKFKKHNDKKIELTVTEKHFCNLLTAPPVKYINGELNFLASCSECGKKQWFLVPKETTNEITEERKIVNYQQKSERAEAYIKNINNLSMINNKHIPIVVEDHGIYYISTYETDEGTIAMINLSTIGDVSNKTYMSIQRFVVNTIRGGDYLSWDDDGRIKEVSCAMLIRWCLIKDSIFNKEEKNHLERLIDAVCCTTVPETKPQEPKKMICLFRRECDKGLECGHGRGPHIRTLGCSNHDRACPGCVPFNPND